MAVTVTDKRGVNGTTWRATVDQYSWASGASTADTDETMGVNGVINALIVTLNNNTNNVTATVALVNNSKTIYTSAAQAENATTTTRFITESGTDLPLSIPVLEDTGITVTPSGDPGAGGLTVDVVFMGT